MIFRDVWRVLEVIAGSPSRCQCREASFFLQHMHRPKVSVQNSFSLTGKLFMASSACSEKSVEIGILTDFSMRCMNEAFTS